MVIPVPYVLELLFGAYKDCIMDITGSWNNGFWTLLTAGNIVGSSLKFGAYTLPRAAQLLMIAYCNTDLVHNPSCLSKEGGGFSAHVIECGAAYFEASPHH